MSPTALNTVPLASGPARMSLAERLQQIVLGWRGVHRNQPVTDLHAECSAAAGLAAHLFLPERVFPVRNLDVLSLRAELARRRLLRSQADPRFRVRPTGRFDAVLVPGGLSGQPCDRWWMFLEESLPPRDQYALYAHALAHGLLNEEARRLGQGALPLDPRDGYAHWELLGELRLMENVRQPQDRRVLEAYPALAELLRSPDEPAAPGTADPSLVDRLGRAGWRGQRIDAPYVYTAGRVYVSDSGIHRGRRLRVDALLRAERSLPIGVAQLLRPREDEEEALLRLEELARERLGVPFAYLVRPGGGITEIDRAEGGETRRSPLTEFPAPAALLGRWLAALGLDDEQSRNALCFPYEVRRDQPLRYYQELATNRAVAAVLQARRGRRPPRVLITQATGTGKTKVAFQVVWKLKQVKAVKNVLFVTDRDWLLTQAMDNEFAPFRDARARIRGELRTAQDVFFATYQALAGAEGRNALYRRYPHNYFDLVIIDECHRGSADEESNWRTILDYFADAVQIGMTATPLRSDNVDTYTYFGQPVAVYSLRQGINDGFLAPYRVRRVLMRGVDDPEGAGRRPTAYPRAVPGGTRGTGSRHRGRRHARQPHGRHRPPPRTLPAGLRPARQDDRVLRGHPPRGGDEGRPAARTGGGGGGVPAAWGGVRRTHRLGREEGAGAVRRTERAVPGGRRHVPAAEHRRRCPHLQERRPGPAGQLDGRVQADHRAGVAAAGAAEELVQHR
jgi:hypothetical protein